MTHRLTRATNGLSRINKDKEINKIASNKKAQIKIWGNWKMELKNIPTINDIQSKNNVLELVIILIPVKIKVAKKQLKKGNHMNAPSVKSTDYKEKLRPGRNVTVVFEMSAQKNKLAFRAVRRLIVFDLMTRPYIDMGPNSIGFDWAERENVKPRSYDQKVNEVLNEIASDYACQITFS